MSRSNPSEHLPNPSTRWFEWNGENGVVRYYDKVKKENVDVPLPFTFLLLDELASVRGWHDASGSGIYSNEVRDTTKDVLVVKSFKGGIIAEGFYREIKDRVNAAGGSYTANCYIAFKDGASLSIAAIRFKGAALGAWMDFRKSNRADLYAKAIKINGYTEGKKGRIVFRMPKFQAADISATTDTQAKVLDKELQAFLDAYVKRNRRDQAEAPSEHLADEDVGYESGAHDDAPDIGNYAPVTDDDIPF